jgi:hypothetical protein
MSSGLVARVSVVLVELVRIPACKKCMPLCALRASFRLPLVVISCCVQITSI